jgi:hypothetical protein
VFSAIPAEAGIQEYQGLVDACFRRGDGLADFLPSHHTLFPDHFFIGRKEGRALFRMERFAVRDLFNGTKPRVQKEYS